MQRFGDLLPLPLPLDHGHDGDICQLGSRRARQRVARRRLLLQREKETVRGINFLAGFEKEAERPMEPQNFAQKSALARVHQAHAQRAPPVVNESGKAALVQLLANKLPSGYFGGSVAGAVTPFERELVSLPRDQQEPVDLLSLLPEGEKSRVQDFESQMLLSEEERGGVLEKCLEGDMYVDPLLAEDKKAYHGLVCDLVRCSLVGFTTSPKSQVGLFFVSKKNGKLRMIIDARRTNSVFRKPPSTQLGSADSWGRAEVEKPGPLFFAQEDVRDFFYRLRIHKALGEFFSLPAVDPMLLKEELGDLPSELADLSDKFEGPIYPHLRVLPMGFAWAFHLAHECHVHLAMQSLPEAGILIDRVEAPVIGSSGHGSGMLIYADNNNHFGQDPEKVGMDQQKMIEMLHANGLSTHELTEPNTLAESLGVRLDGQGGTICSTPSRDWRLYRALGAIADDGFPVAGEEMRIVIGHMTMRATLNRQLMGILRHCYVFVQASFKKRQRVWKSVAKELQIFKGLMALGFSDIFSGWSSRMLCTDACLSGYAVWRETTRLMRPPGLVGQMNVGDFVEEMVAKLPPVQKL